MKSAKQINTGFYHYERILSITVNGDCIYQSATQEATNIPSKQVVLFPLDQVSTLNPLSLSLLIFIIVFN